MKRLDGVNTLLMTPYTESNEIDVHGIFRQIDRVLDAGATSVVVQGKIGEYDTYTMDERRDTARAVVEYVNGAAPVGVGIINAAFDDGLAVGTHRRRIGRGLRDVASSNRRGFPRLFPAPCRHRSRDALRPGPARRILHP